MADQTNMGYPTISEKAWWIIRDKFKASLPSSFSPTYVKSLLSMSSDSSANSNIITPMRRLGLIDEENKPTALANQWRIDDTYGKACETMLKTVYPVELLDLFPDEVVDKNSARTWFMSNGVGQAAADKMIALFALLKDGKVKDKKVTSTKKANASNPVKEIKKSPIPRAEKSIHTESLVTEPVAQKSVPASNRPNLHIDLQIHISPESTPEQIECIFASMAKHLYGESK